MSELQLSEWEKIPFLDFRNLPGRVVSSLSFFDDGEWHCWLANDTSLLKYQGYPAEGIYFSKHEENKDDVHLEFIEFIVQKACFHKVVLFLDSLVSDFLNITASLKKFEILFDSSKGCKTTISRLAVTELEYLFSLCRSIFDLLQELICIQWEMVELKDKSQKKKKLKKSFAKMVFKNNKLQNCDEIKDRFKIPLSLAKFYSNHSSFFKMLRTFRDNFVHGGKTVDIVFTTERGFAVKSNQKPFSEFGVWNEEHKLPNDLCSLRPAIAFIIEQTILACENYAVTMQKIVEYPPPIVPDFHVFLRGHFTGLLQENSKVLSECKWYVDT